MCFGYETPKKATAAPAKPLGNANEQSNATVASGTGAKITGGFAGPGGITPKRVDVGGTTGQGPIKNFLDVLAARIEAEDRKTFQEAQATPDNPFDGDIWPSLQAALTTPTLAIFRAWSRQLARSTSPQLAVREVVLAVVAPYFDFLGGRDAVTRLVDGWVDQVGYRLSGNGFTFDRPQYEALVAGLMIGFRVAQLSAAKNLMYGLPLPVGRGPIDRSGGMAGVTVTEPTAWAGKAEAYPFGETSSIFADSAK